MAHYHIHLNVLLTISIIAVSSLTTEQISKFNSSVIQFADGGHLHILTSIGYPSHEINNSVNPATATAQNFSFNISKTPENTGNVVYCTSLGPVGFAINGVAIYNALTGQTTDAVEYETFDNCKGHSSPDGAYHYHQYPVCVGNMQNVDEFIGVALDGNPIYGPKASDKTELLTSADLDKCHGRFVGAEYRYHITADFPYIIGCYKAEPARSAQAGGNGQTGGGGANLGPTSGGDGPPPGRKKRQTAEVSCENTQKGELCDCTSGRILTRCDTLMTEAAIAANCSNVATTQESSGKAAITDVSYLLLLMAAFIWGLCSA